MVKAKQKASSPAAKLTNRSPRNGQITLISVGWKALGRDDEDLPDWLQEHFGKRSRKQMSYAELRAAVDKLKELGFKPTANNKKRKPLKEDIHAKLLALWISAYWLGVVDDRSDKALDDFVRRMKKVDSVRWLHPADAAKVTEALKAWIARVAGFQWSTVKGWHAKDVMQAQWSILVTYGWQDGLVLTLKKVIAKLDNKPLEEITPAYLRNALQKPSIEDGIIAELGASVRAFKAAQTAAVHQLRVIKGGRDG